MLIILDSVTKLKVEIYLRAKKVDKNQKELCDYAKSIGVSVCYLHAVGSGVPDIILGYDGINYLCEIKTQTGKLNELQVKWFEDWSGQCTVIRTKEDIRNLVGL